MNSHQWLVSISLQQELGNQLEKTKNNERLQEILTNAVIMVVSVSASTTQGTELTEHELGIVFEACDMVSSIHFFLQRY